MLRVWRGRRRWDGRRYRQAFVQSRKDRHAATARARGISIGRPARSPPSAPTLPEPIAPPPTPPLLCACSPRSPACYLGPEVDQSSIRLHVALRERHRARRKRGQDLESCSRLYGTLEIRPEQASEPAVRGVQAHETHGAATWVESVVRELAERKSEHDAMAREGSKAQEQAWRESWEARHGGECTSMSSSCLMSMGRRRAVPCRAAWICRREEGAPRARHAAGARADVTGRRAASRAQSCPRLAP